MKRRLTIWGIGLAAVIGTVAGGYFYNQHHRYKHLATHDEGLVYRAAWLEPDVLDEVIEKYQIRAVVNLCNPGEMGEPRWEGERKAVTNAGARLIELPMTLNVEAEDPTISDHLEVLSDPNNYPMLVHCQHGVTRTAKFLSLYDIKYRGLSAEDSLARQPLFGRDDHNVNVRAFVKNFDKEYNKLYPTASAEDIRVLRQ